MSMKKTLETHGYVVHAADNSEAGIATFRQNKNGIAVSILDHVMPGDGGRLILEHVLKEDPQASLIVVSGFSRDYVRRCLPLGAWSFLQKPFDEDQLLDTVKDVIRKKSTPDDKWNPAITQAGISPNASRQNTPKRERCCRI